MSEKDLDQHLRAMAKGAGLTLVKSRRRKPGVGDYGLYGLKTPEGQPCFGVEDNGLTATPADIERYLQERARQHWRQSAAAAKPLPQRPKRKVKERDESVSPRAPKSKAARAKVAEGSTSGRARQASSPRKQKAAAAVQPQPSLKVRDAKPSDAPSIARLIGQLSLSTSEKDIAREIRSAKRRHEAPVVAELGEVVGCAGYHPVPALHRGSPIGRITLLIVDAAHRRKGIGTRLLEEVEARLAAKGCSAFEIISEITFQSPAGFLRKRSFDERSYRFAKARDARRETPRR